MDIYLVGQKQFGADVFRLCLRRGYRVVGACAPREASRPGASDRLRAAAEAAGIPVAAPGDLSPAAIPACDLIVCAHAHVFISAAMRSRARGGAIGYHPSLLPRHRGKNAVADTIACGDTVAGGSVYWLDDGYDTGPILARDRCPVLRDNARDLWRDQLAPLGLALLEEALALVAVGSPRRVPQSSYATPTPVD